MIADRLHDSFTSRLFAPQLAELATGTVVAVSRPEAYEKSEGPGR
jgi:hypothetical protein